MSKQPIPPLTCPHINRVIELVEEIVNLSKEPETSQDILEKYKNIITTEMEFIRTSNDELRESGKYWYEQSKTRKTRKRST